MGHTKKLLVLSLFLLSVGIGFKNHSRNSEVVSDSPITKAEKNEEFAHAGSLKQVSKPKVTPLNLLREESFDWQHALRLDHFCEYLKYDSKLSKAAKVAALINASGPLNETDAAAQLIYLETIPLKLPVPLTSQNNSELDFYNALAAADLIDGISVREDLKNLKGADTLLSDLETKEPRNGACPFFRAGVRAKLSPDDRGTIKQLLLRAFRSPLFDTHYVTLLKRMREKSLTNATYSLMGTELASSFPVPKYGDVIRLIKEFTLTENQHFAQEAYHFGRALVQPAIDANYVYQDWNWSVLEYSFGRVIATAAFMKLNPNADLPLPIQKHPFTWPRGFDDFSSDEALTSEHCDRRVYDQIYAKELMYYEAHRI